MRVPLMLALSLLLVACTAQPDRQAPSAATAPGAGQPLAAPGVQALPRFATRQATDQCGSARVRHLVGQQAPDPFPVSVPVRVFRSGDALTMDHRPDRLNVELDRRTGRILAVYCG